MAKTATALKAPKVAKPRTPKVYTLEIGAAGMSILRKLAPFRVARLEAERGEKPLKEALKLLYADAGAKLKKDDRINVLVKGKVVGTVLCAQGPKSVDFDLLLEGFPEAYEACVSDTTQLRFTQA